MKMMCLILAFLVVSMAGVRAAEEFVGPFASWRNVKTDYGAAGDGKADDTAAIQRAFDELQKHEKACVLYFPAGTYRITDTVKTVRKAHTDCMGISVVGEDPAKTTIRWDGKEGGLMMQYDAWYSRISRLTLDGAGKAGTALGWGNAFSTYDECSDMVFRDVKDGLVMSLGGAGQAENAVLRCRFLRCSHAGILTTCFNSLDIWAWYCRFEECGYGLYNNAGNFHCYKSLFLRSAKADIGTANLMVFSFVDNVSVGSRCFMDFAGGHSWGSPTSITGNRILEPTGDFAIRLGNGGPYLVAYNTIRSRPDATTPAVEMTWGDNILIGNTYTVANPVKEAGKFRRVGERVVDAKSISATLPELPGPPAPTRRRVFDVPAGAAPGIIQAALAQAAALKGQRPVVHLPMGTYKIDRTLEVPAGSDVQIVGDGGAETGTILQWTGPAVSAGAAPINRGPLLHLAGPSRASIRDVYLNTGPAGGILVDDCDQPGATVFADQLNVTGQNDANKPAAGLLVNGVENADVLAQCLQGATCCRKWVSVVGGEKRRAGRPAPGQVTIACGATGSADAQYAVSDGGQLVVRSVYHEMSGAAPQGILLDGDGRMTIDATRFSYKTSPEKPLIEARDFRGEFGLFTSLLLPVNSTTTARVQMAGDGSKANVLCAGDLFWVNELGVTADKVWQNDARPAARAAMLCCNMNSGTKDALKNGFGHLEDRGEADDAFLARMVQPLQDARIWLPAERPTPAGATAVSFHRVMVSTGKDAVAVELRAGK